MTARLRGWLRAVDLWSVVAETSSIGCGAAGGECEEGVVLCRGMDCVAVTVLQEEEASAERSAVQRLQEQLAESQRLATQQQQHAESHEGLRSEVFYDCAIAWLVACC